MGNILAVGLGGAIGSILRLKLGGIILHAYPNAKFPWSTFFVNILGCLLIGIVAGIIETRHEADPKVRAFLITGLLGGFTTFSAFGFESVFLIRQGEAMTVILYVTSSVVLGILAVVFGLKLVGG